MMHKPWKMVITPALRKPMVMTDVAPLDWINAVVAAPIPIPANLLSLILLKRRRTPRPLNFFNPDDIIDMPVINKAIPTSN